MKRSAKAKKEELFEDFFRTADKVFSTFEGLFDLPGARAKILGIEDEDFSHPLSPEMETRAKAHLRNSPAWKAASDLYDYAIDGILEAGAPEDVVIDGAEALSFLKTENASVSDDWDGITAMGDGRFALDSGGFIEIQKVALLAHVDVRTARNAVSAGELAVDKTYPTLIENTSARKWLLGRRGFVPTVISKETVQDLDAIATPSEFGAFLARQRNNLGIEFGSGKVLVFHPAVNLQALKKLESGIFDLPLDVIEPLAHFYRVDKRQLLMCVMRVFFRHELALISAG